MSTQLTMLVVRYRSIRIRRSHLGMLVCLCWLIAELGFGLVSAPALAQGTSPQPISSVQIRYADTQIPQPNHPTIERLLATPVDFLVRPDGFAAVRPADDPQGTVVRSSTLGTLGQLDPAVFYPSAVEAIASSLRQRLAEDGFMAYVAVEPLSAATRRAAHPDDPTRLDIVIEIEVGPFPVSEFIFRYFEDHPRHPSVEDVANVQVELARTEQGWVAPRAGLPTQRLRLGSVAEGDTQQFYASALRNISQSVLGFLLDQELLGVYVIVDPEDIVPETIEDRRPIGEDSLHILMYSGIIRELRTLAFGDRVAMEDRENNKVHDRIARLSPFQPLGEDDDPDDPDRRDLLTRDDLENYLFRLNRLPGRRVDAALSAGDEGGVVVDYLISENRPFVIYGQVSNTGTKQTNRIRQRYGLILNQLTNNDDIFSLEYVTAGFSDANAVIGSYEAPVFDLERLRWKVFGAWSEFTASEVGLANEQFTGESWNVGLELAWNVFQHREFFVDVVGGAKWMNAEVNNEFAAIRGEDNFFMPYIGVRMERQTNISTTAGALTFEWNIPGIAGTDEEEVNRLGRLFVDRDWMTMQWDLNHSFFLEPVLNRRNWEDLSTPSSSTLAHELYLGFKGQYAFGNRLIPQAQQVVGGLYTVRGYPESIAAGDSVLIGNLEYRFHLPRAFPYEEEASELFGRPFRRVPQEPYGMTDWNLMFRAFLDVGRTMNSDRLPFETDATLVGAGVGAEFSFYRNLNVRVDWGFALRDVFDGEVRSGSNRVHLVATILF